MSWERHLRANFRSLVVLACLFYLFIEALYVARLPLAMDEFQGAHTVRRLLDQVPYRDFGPYKTVLGYYLQLPPLVLAPTPWAGLLWTKGWMALLNATLLCGIAVGLSRIYRKAAVCLALFLLVTMSTFLEQSAVLRVDMMTALFGLVSLLLLLRERFAWAGVTAALGFLVSQKGIYFLLAGAAALVLHAGLARPSRETARRVLTFALPAGSVLAAYGILWSVIGSVDTFWSATVTSHTEIALRPLYRIHHYWIQTLSRNPYFYGVSVLALGALVARRVPEREGDQSWHLSVYGLTLFGLCLWHKQPWPYFFVFLIPTCFVLAAAFFDGELARADATGRRLGTIFLTIYVAAGILYPLGRLRETLPRDNSFQRNTLEVATALLGREETYLAGLNLAYTRRQVLPELAWLDARRLDALGRLDAPAIRALLSRLEAAPPKLVVDNYRIEALPDPINRYLDARYAPLWGNLRIYAPAVPPSATRFSIGLEGEYGLEGEPKGPIVIDGRPLEVGSTLRLTTGIHSTESTQPFRLRYRVEIPESLKRDEFRESRPLFAEVYD